MAEATGATTPLRVHVPEHASRRVTMYPRQAAARPPHYLLPPPSRRHPEAPERCGSMWVAGKLSLASAAWAGHPRHLPVSSKMSFFAGSTTAPLKTVVGLILSSMGMRTRGRRPYLQRGYIVRRLDRWQTAPTKVDHCHDGTSN